MTVFDISVSIGIQDSKPFDVSPVRDIQVHLSRTEELVALEMFGVLP